MISAPNPRLPLNGNSWIFLLLVLFSACSIKQARRSPAPADQNEPPEVVKSDEIDTIQWTVISEQDYPPIRNIGKSFNMKTEIKDRYKIVLMVPFAAQNVRTGLDPIRTRSQRMIQFYAGLRYGLDESSEFDNIDLKVIDTRGSNTFVENSDLDELLEDCDVVIGPYLTENLKTTADYCKNRGIICISPWNTLEVSEQNPFYIQLRPSLKTHIQFISQYVTTEYSDEEILLIAHAQDSMLVNLFQESKRNLASDSSFTQFRELIIDDPNTEELQELVDTIISEGIQAVILGNWREQSFVLSMLGKLNFAEKENKITVFGFPQWIDFTRMDYDYYENLNVHVSSESPLYYEGVRAEIFKRYFKNKYGTIPEDDAYYGLDLIEALGQWLNEFGNKFYEAFSGPSEASFRSFDIGSRYSEEYPEVIEKYENEFVRMLKFENYRFVETKQF